MAAWDAWCQNACATSGMFEKLGIMSAGPTPTPWGSYPSNCIDANYLAKTWPLLESGKDDDIRARGLFDGANKYIYIKLLEDFTNGKCAVARGKDSYSKNYLLIFGGKKTIMFGVLKEGFTGFMGSQYLSSCTATLESCC